MIKFILFNRPNFGGKINWVAGVDRFEYTENEVTRIGTEHVCVVNEKHFDFTTVTKKGKPGQLIYGEMTTSPPPVDELYQFYIICPLTHNSCRLEIETYWKSRSPTKKLVMALLLKKAFRKNTQKAIDGLFEFVSTKKILA